ncbi:hypothetical protein Pcinc_012736 [Petrolisthes cinctipes]|uniref:Uncharacterized protein n=1 Tax=Petrolisthes cinctipes TaxID=88211 RepID=A0AAE1G003_PETCI|nr:hypothetical protein Pcinc_012736 [Petrolisthes cinctipes]
MQDRRANESVGISPRTQVKSWLDSMQTRFGWITEKSEQGTPKYTEGLGPLDPQETHCSSGGQQSSQRSSNISRKFWPGSNPWCPSSDPTAKPPPTMILASAIVHSAYVLPPAVVSDTHPPPSTRYFANWGCVVVLKEIVLHQSPSLHTPTLECSHN